MRRALPSGLMFVTATESFCCALTRTVIFIFTVVFPYGSAEKAGELHPFSSAGHRLALHTLPQVRSSKEHWAAVLLQATLWPSHPYCKELATESSKLISSGWEGGREGGKSQAQELK